MAYASKVVRAVAKAIVEVQTSRDHEACRVPAFCEARAAIRAYLKASKPKPDTEGA